MQDIETASTDKAEAMALESVSIPDKVRPPELPQIPFRTQLKIDARLILAVGVVYSLSVIDRINIGQVGCY